MRDELPAGLDAVTLWNALAATMGQTLPLAGRARAVLALGQDAGGVGAVYELATDAGPVFARLGRLPLGAMTQSSLDAVALEALPPALGDAVLSLCVDLLVGLVGSGLGGRVTFHTGAASAKP